MFSVADLDAAIKDANENEWDEYGDGYEHLFYEDGPFYLRGNLATIEVVKGDDDVETSGEGPRTLVFKVGERYFRKDGYYSSYGDGLQLDGPLREVNVVEKTVIFYE